jgi:signal transduction histidine kinase
MGALAAKAMKGSGKPHLDISGMAAPPIGGRLIYSWNSRGFRASNVKMAQGYAAGEQNQPEPAPPQKVKILLVDDSESNLITLESILDDLGQELVRATSGREALRYLLREDFAVILLDVKMLDKDGFETAAQIRERARFRHTPILFLTAHNHEELRSKVSVFVDLSLKSELLSRQVEMLRARNDELERLVREKDEAEQRVRALNAELEACAADRTAELTKSNEDLCQFAYAASHDLKEPLRTITSYSQLLSAHYQQQLDESGKEFLAYVIDAVKRMDVLLTDLLKYSQQLGPPKWDASPTNAEAVLFGVLMNLQASISDTGAVITHDPLPTAAYSDFAQLSLVFQNLVSNALKYGKPGEPPCVHIWATEGADEWTFYVRDNGLGIADEYKNQIFGLFKRLHGREYPGTGIGLAICTKIIEQHGGRIWVESQPGQGSTFLFTIRQ